MRTLSLFIATSLDGFIAGPKGEIDWLFSDADYGYKKFYGKVDTVIMGRKTWELAKTFEAHPHKGKECVVFTRKKIEHSFPNVRVEKNIVKTILNLKRKKGKRIWLVGGGEIVRACENAGLIDEYRIFVHPIVLGKGISLFGETKKRTRLKVEKAHAFPSGLIELSYVRASKRA